jgi:metal-responsive CopG/Arc/MetJ family transcriptional regulator
MAARRRFTFAFPPDLASNLETVIPRRQRNQFVAEAVRARLKELEREALRADMEECARIMHDEIMQIEAEFAPLDAEVDRLL